MSELSKTETVRCQQESKNSSDSVESKQRLFYPKKFDINRNISLNNFFCTPVPNQEFLILRKSAVALCIVRHHIMHCTYNTVLQMDRTKTINVDIAETRWTSQRRFADLFGVDERIIKRTEKALKDAGVIVTMITQTGMKKRRYMALSKVSMGWLRLGGDMPIMKKINDLPRYKKVYLPGTQNCTSEVQKSVHENKSDENKQDNIDDDEQAPSNRLPEQPTPPPTAPPISSSSLKFSSEIKTKPNDSPKGLQRPLGMEGSKDQIFGLTDRLTIVGNKPYPEINEFWNEAIKLHGFKACDQFLKMDQKFRWNPESQKSILSSVSELANPEAFELKKQATQASQEAKAQARWDRNDWQGYIYGIEMGTAPIKPASQIPEDLQDSLNKALMQTNHNHKQEKPKTDSKITLSYLSSICPEAAKNIKRRMK